MTTNIFHQAFDPKQYDSQDVYWSTKQERPSSDTDFKLSFFSTYRKLWKNASILDIGCGTGWILKQIHNEGAALVHGIDPSENNILTAQKLHPEISFFTTDLNSFVSDTKYDYIISIMAFNHINDLAKAMNKCFSLMKLHGKLFLVVPDYDYTSRKRHDYDVEVEHQDDDTYAVRVKRNEGSIADIVRKKKVYISAAEQAGFALTEQIPMKPTKELIADRPSYKVFENVPITHLLVFDRS